MLLIIVTFILLIDLTFSFALHEYVKNSSITEITDSYLNNGVRKVDYYIHSMSMKDFNNKDFHPLWFLEIIEYILREKFNFSSDYFQDWKHLSWVDGKFIRPRDVICGVKDTIHFTDFKKVYLKSSGCLHHWPIYAYIAVALFIIVLIIKELRDGRNMTSLEASRKTVWEFKEVILNNFAKDSWLYLFLSYGFNLIKWFVQILLWFPLPSFYGLGVLIYKLFKDYDWQYILGCIFPDNLTHHIITALYYYFLNNGTFDITFYISNNLVSIFLPLFKAYILYVSFFKLIYLIYGILIYRKIIKKNIFSITKM